MKRKVLVLCLAFFCVLLVGCATNQNQEQNAFPLTTITFGMTWEEVSAALEGEMPGGNPVKLRYEELGMKNPEVFGMELARENGGTGEYYTIQCYFSAELDRLNPDAPLYMVQMVVLSEDIEQQLTDVFGEPVKAMMNYSQKEWTGTTSDGSAYSVDYLNTGEVWDGMGVYHLFLECK